MKKNVILRNQEWLIFLFCGSGGRRPDDKVREEGSVLLSTLGLVSGDVSDVCGDPLFSRKLERRRDDIPRGGFAVILSSKSNESDKRERRLERFRRRFVGVL